MFVSVCECELPLICVSVERVTSFQTCNFLSGVVAIWSDASFLVDGLRFCLCTEELKQHSTARAAVEK